MQTGTFERFTGEAETDETFVGGLAKHMHKDVRRRKITGTGGKDKTIVVGTLERGGQVRNARARNPRGRAAPKPPLATATSTTASRL